ncbi:LamG-like jellyroll fold domain-containing protein [Pirellulimonas nuda]|uniref:LamG-like jellyroll fold domain-containing protein n=1 Tax=Pirellulimonas nuda TaxID=2528009 RepID=UPI0018D4C17E|nr:LamG-like jellyroll fold domain-containing protein [Pirellulimonas nuda]
MASSLICVATAGAEAALIRHWALDEANLTDPGNNTYAGIIDSTGNSTGATLFGYNAGKDMAALGVVNVPGPTGFGTAYNFTEVPGENAGISGVFTNSLDAIPATGDFSLQVVMNSTNVAGNSNLFSNNNGQGGRAGLQTDASGNLFWFHNGGVNITTTANVTDGAWHMVGIAREGTRFDLFVDGVIVGTGDSAGAISTAQSWMIGRQRSSGGGYNGLVADVKIYDSYQLPGALVPEPAGIALLGLAAAAMAAGSRRGRMVS